MLKEFYIADKQKGHTHDVDVSLFANFEQLEKHLTKLFAFADTKSMQS